MLYRRFGRTELSMPVFSCGGMRYQHRWQDLDLSEIPIENQENLEATIRRALDLGITHIETARGYGTSEVQLGQILPKLPREKLIVQTKVVPVALDRPQEFRQQFDTSLVRLKLDYIDLFAIHGINDPHTLQNTLAENGCLSIAKQLQQEGKLRFIGFSTHGPTDVIVQAIESNQFDYVNLHWYYINQINWPAIEAAQKHDMGVFIISPSDKGGLLYKPSQRLIDLCAPLSPMVFNDLFCLSHPQVHTLSLGAARPQDFDEHLKTLALLDQADEILPPIVQRLEQAAIDRLGEAWVKTWEQGLPRYDQVPNKMNIRVILWLSNLVTAYDMLEYAKMRYNLLGQGGTWFPGTNAADFDPEALKDCLKHSPHAAVISDRLRAAHELLGGEAVQRLSKA
jgi:predicted aldo/keto reductase-like oxidoreductase